ncbi:MarR family transcriptional regulator [Nocardia flavorosea]|uniref:MarR family transcriptional regulator n=2 Tax=Nocardia flavorosea TaxID=53429 RepID=A0A846Y9V9_9NOCA|nr:MarR family transcriptional regulator [Nocardia flavorosea]
MDLVEFETMIFSRFSTASRHRGEPVLDRSAYLLLSRIDAERPMSINELSGALGLNPSTLTRQASAAVRAGILQRTPDPAGGLARKYELTDRGRQRLAEQRRAHREFVAEVLQDWNSDDVTAFAAYLCRFNSDVENRQGVAWPRRAPR